MVIIERTKAEAMTAIQKTKIPRGRCSDSIEDRSRGYSTNRDGDNRNGDYPKMGDPGEIQRNTATIQRNMAEAIQKTVIQRGGRYNDNGGNTNKNYTEN